MSAPFWPVWLSEALVTRCAKASCQRFFIAEHGGQFVIGKLKSIRAAIDADFSRANRAPFPQKCARRSVFNTNSGGWAKLLIWIT
jgi:hypothetical protein